MVLHCQRDEGTIFGYYRLNSLIQEYTCIQMQNPPEFGNRTRLGLCQALDCLQLNTKESRL